MSVEARRRRAGIGARPARDLPFVDALAVVAALTLAYAVRAKLDSSVQFGFDSIFPFVRVAMPAALAMTLLAAAGLSLYDERTASTAGLRVHLAAAAYATAAVGLVAIYRGGGSDPSPGLVVFAGCLLAIGLHSGRLLYWRAVAGSDDDSAGQTDPDRGR